MTRIMARDVAEHVAKTNLIPWPRFISQVRSRDVARPRQVAMYAIRELCPHMSMPAIGRLLGGRDHTTILHGLRKIEDLIAIDRDVARQVRAVVSHFEMRSDGEAIISHAQKFSMLCAGYGKAMGLAA